MPTLEWIGKDKVVNHHQEVPYRVLERQYSYDEAGQHAEDNGSENMIIHGDNLEALKALLPRYEGKVKCIYIDPPYNTGNEKWVYNDNVNDPKIKKWLGEVVGKEGEDLSRHDKWLCMMYPRLKLLQRLLAEDGVIFISIDDNELYNLKSICDEIFGLSCFVSNISWQRTYSMRNDAKGIPAEVEHILVYGKRADWQPQKLERTESMDSKYKNPDHDPKGAWRNIVASAPDSVAGENKIKLFIVHFSDCFRWHTKGKKDSYFTHLEFHKNGICEKKKYNNAKYSDPIHTKCNQISGTVCHKYICDCRAEQQNSISPCHKDCKADGEA